MAFSFGGTGGFTFGQTVAPDAVDPLDDVEYTGDLVVDSYREWDVLLSALRGVEPKSMLCLVFPGRAECTDFMERWHLPSGRRHFDGVELVQALSVAPLEGRFEYLAPKLSRSKEVAPEHEDWVSKSRAERDRFFRETDSEFYIVFDFECETDLIDAVVRLGLSEVPWLEVSAVRALSGPAVDEVLVKRFE
ncbi:hypothetical protein [Kocuria massiliensis]|uniref:hypothetical protein n=1 Tax=Kocuria massiliensis TaxID=1926282 RepID=UPI0022B9AC4F|nr:hypothetical protein [Kocuria massiliensis]